MATAGYNVIGSSEDFDSSDDGDANGPYTVGAGSIITGFHAALKSTAGGDTKYRPLIYADSAGEPAALIATLAEITVLNAETTMTWRDLTGLSVPVSVNAIWIGLWYRDGGNYRYAYDTVGFNASRYNSNLAVYSSTNPAPTPWPGGAATSTQKHSVYVDYTPAGAAPRPNVRHAPGTGLW